MSDMGKGRNPDSLGQALRIAGLEKVGVFSVAEELQEPLIRGISLWQQALAPNTLRARAADLRSFVAWCDQAGVEPFRSVEKLPNLMEKHLEDLTRQKAAESVRRASCSLAGLSKVLGTDVHSRGTTERRRLLVRAAQKTSGIRGRRHEKHRLTKDEMSALRNAIRTANTPPMRRARDEAMLAIMCDVLARRSEVVGFTVADVDLQAGQILIGKSKTDQEAQGVIFELSAETVRAVAAWLTISGLGRASPSEQKFLPLFPGIHVSGKILWSQSGRPEAMDGRSVARILAGYGEAIGIVGMAGHTIRRSVARILFEAGMPEDEIVQRGRWSSLEQMRDYVGIDAPRKGAAGFVFG
jgi:integrase